MQWPTTLLGAVFIIIGLVYIIRPATFFQFDRGTIARRGTKSKSPKMSEEWLASSRYIGAAFVLIGVLIILIFELMTILS